jgi:hypothetical protein
LIDGSDYFDVDLDILKSHDKKKHVVTESLFVSITGGKLVISVNGLSFADVLYVKEIPDHEKYSIAVDPEYTSVEILNNSKLVQIQGNEQNQQLINQFDLFLSETEFPSQKKNTRLLFSQDYE